MEHKGIVSTYKYQVYIALMWLLAFAIVFPVGEFAVNDDWAYAKNVHNLVVNKTFVVDEWPAMNLISQTMYGSIVTSIFGFSFTALRCSIFLLSLCSSLYLFKVIKKLSSNNEYVAFAFTATLIVNAVYMHLSMTFMTDVFFASMLIFALHALVNYNASGKVSAYVWFCFWLVIAMLSRQQALVFGLLIVPSVIKQQKNVIWKVVLAALPTFLCWLASDKYRHHLVANHIGHNIQQMHHLVEYLKDAPIDKHLLQAAEGLLVLGSILLPVSLFLLLQYRKEVNRKALLLLLLTSVGAFVLTMKALGQYPSGNILKVLEIGPRVIKANGDPISAELSATLRRFYYLLDFVSLSLLLFFLIKKWSIRALFVEGFWGKMIYVAVAGIYLVFVSVSNAYFDRYIFPVALLALMLLVPLNTEVSRRTRMITTSVILLIYAISLIENRDYFTWQKQRSAAIAYLYAHGAKPNEIDGGFEFNGWVKKNNIYPSDKQKSWWWVVEDNYIVSGAPVIQTKTDTIFVYQRLIPFEKDTVFVVSKLEKVPVPAEEGN